MLSGLPSAFGFRGTTQPVNKWPYSFGDRYIYDNAGSRWNYGSGYSDHLSKRQPKYWQPRFEYKYKVEGHTDEKFQDLIEHLSEHQFRPEDTFHYGPICR